MVDQLPFPPSTGEFFPGFQVEEAMRLGLDFLKFFPVEVGWVPFPMILKGHFITPPPRRWSYMWKIEEWMDSWIHGWIHGLNSYTKTLNV